MEALIFIACIFGYFMIGTVFAGIVTRAMVGDSSLVAPCVIIWPILMPIMFLIFVYSKIVHRRFHEVAR